MKLCATKHPQSFIIWLIHRSDSSPAFFKMCSVFFHWYISDNNFSIRVYSSLPLQNRKHNQKIISLTSVFSESIEHDLSRSIYLSNISLSVIYFLSSLSSHHGYFLFSDTFSSFFNSLTNVLHSLHNFFADSN